MIFVTVGTTDYDDLVQTMDAMAPSLEEECVAQIGRGTYVPQNMTHFRFAPSLDPYYHRARIVVAHGGLGTMMEVLGRGMPLVGLSNPDRYDRHQDDLLGVLEARGHMIWCRDLADLKGALRAASDQEFAPYAKPDCHIAAIIRRYLAC